MNEYSYACGGKLGLSHNCNRYDEKTASSYDAIRRQMLRFTHYCDRFNVHAASRKAEQEGTLWPSILKRILQLESAPNVRPLNRDASWLARAYHALLASRLVLSRSYAFAYYMFGDEVRTRPADRASLAMGKELFENQQEQLERNAERLSKVLATEAPPVLEEDQLVRTMQETVNLAKIVDSHCREMYTCIQDELLPLLLETMNIAPYRPDGPDKAKDLPA
jgi:ariadne-1